MNQQEILGQYVKEGGSSAPPALKTGLFPRMNEDEPTGRTAVEARRIIIPEQWDAMGFVPRVTAKDCPADEESRGAL